MKTTRELSPKAKAVFKLHIKYFTDTFPRLKGNGFLGCYNRYFKLEKEKDGYKIDRSWAILPWLTDWAATELEETKYENYYDEEGNLIFQQRDPKYFEVRSKIMTAVPELYSIVTYKKEVYQLIQQSLPYVKFDPKLDYSQCESFFKLVEMDKEFITSNWGSEIIRFAEYYSNKKFFKQLSQAVRKPGFRENLKQAEFGLALILLFYLGGRRLFRHQFLSELEGLGYSHYKESLGAFEKLLSRLGLKK